MDRITNASIWTAIFVLILLISVGSVSAQNQPTGSTGPLWEDTAINPHDFTNAYYSMNGIFGRAILDRRTGSDGLSTFGNSSNPFHRNIRVTATIPAYNESGAMLFWYPLGQIMDDGFTEETIGWEAREMARRFPIYVFPHSKLQDPRIVFNTRQAALIDNTWETVLGQDSKLNPLGIREIFLVTFTEKAFTEEGKEMMSYMGKKNGMGADETPILCSMEDLRMMMKYDLVTARAPMIKSTARFAIAPTIDDPTHGVIAPDAFLMFATKDGTPLDAERKFSTQFGCLQKYGTWCKE